MSAVLPLLQPDWVAPPGVHACMSTRAGGVSVAPWDSLNLSRATGDDPAAVAENRRRFEAALGVPLILGHLVHGAAALRVGHAQIGQALPSADAVWTTEPGLAVGVSAADCLSVLLADREGRAVAAAHAGWRGLAAGVLANTVQALCDGAACSPQALVAWLGPCIGPRQFEVGADVLEAFAAPHAGDPHFQPRPRPDGAPRWLADLPALARQQLQRAGVHSISGGHACTVEDASRFFSFRRDSVTGRMVAAVWRDSGRDSGRHSRRQPNHSA